MPGTPPPCSAALPLWGRALAPPAAGDGLNSLRAEIGAHTPERSPEQKLADVLRELQEDETRYLRNFEDARKKGGLTEPSVRQGLSSHSSAHSHAQGGACAYFALFRPALCSAHPERCAPAGDQKAMEDAQLMWRHFAEKLELLRRDPDAYVKRWGWRSF